MSKELITSIWHILIAPFTLTLRFLFKTVITPFLLFFDILVYGLFTLPLATFHKLESFLPENFSLVTFSEILHVTYYYIFVATIVGTVCAFADLFLIHIVHKSVRFSELTFTIPYINIPLVFQGGAQALQEKVNINVDKASKPESLVCRPSKGGISELKPLPAPAVNDNFVFKSNGYQDELSQTDRSQNATAESESEDSTITSTQMSHRDMSTVRTEMENTELK